MQKRSLILLLILGIAVAYSLISLNATNEQVYGDFQSDYSPDDNNDAQQSQANTPTYSHSAQNNSKPSLSNNVATSKTTSINNELPYSFKVVGIHIASKEDNYNNDDKSLVMIQFENELYEHYLHDFILKTDMQLVKIDAQQISVSYEDTIYTKSLTPPNILAEDFRKPDKSYSELIEMTADEIGSRPRIMEHLIELTQTPYIADGAIVGPGLNPALFDQAGFQVDDVLQSINGKSVTVESELDDIKENLKTAQTLTFLVKRKGRTVTLYLDIPSETLELTRD